MESSANKEQAKRKGQVNNLFVFFVKVRFW